MAWGGLWAYPAVKKFFDDNAKKNGFDSEDIGGMAWPAFVIKGSPSTFAGGWSQMVNARSPYLDEAKHYVEWLWIKNTKIQTDWNLSYGFHVPPRQSVARAAKALDAPVPAQAAKDLAQHGGALGPSWTSGMGTALSDAANNIVGAATYKSDLEARLKIATEPEQRKNLQTALAQVSTDAQAELNTAQSKCQRELNRLLR